MTPKLKKIIAREGLILAVSLLLCSVTFAAPASYEEFDTQMMRVALGMNKADALELVGEPISVVQKSLDSKGRLVETYRYDYVPEDIMQTRLYHGYWITYVDNVVSVVEREPRNK